MTASMIAVWQGPFHDAQVHGAASVSYGGHVRLTAGQGASTVVLANVASQLATADPSWWTFH